MIYKFHTCRTDNYQSLKYIIRVEAYDDVFAIKFYAARDRKLDNRYNRIIKAHGYKGTLGIFFTCASVIPSLITTNELIPISENNGKRAVNARDLHAFLESKRDFSTWIKDRIKSYDFVEGVDFQSFTEIVEREIGATTRIEYALSISMAKELSMIENNERGKQARKYFIACEENKHELSRKELAIMVIQAEEEKERLALENEKQQKQIEKLQPKADFAEAAFPKKIRFSFGSMESLRNFVPFTDDDCIRYVKQAVKLLISYMGFFLCPYWILAVAFT